MTLAILILAGLMSDFDSYYQFMPVEYMEFCRFICTLILHLSLVGELTGALERCKYVINHHYFFEKPYHAYLCALMQAIAVYSTEGVSLFVILGTEAPEDTVMNFIALAIIADFDDYVFESTSNEILKKLFEDEFCEELFVIRHTSSKRSKDWEITDEIIEGDTEPRKLKIRLSERTWHNKMGYMMYKLLRGFYVSFYFYFEPFWVVLLSVWLPMFKYCNDEGVCG